MNLKIRSNNIQTRRSNDDIIVQICLRVVEGECIVFTYEPHTSFQYNFKKKMVYIKKK